MRSASSDAQGLSATVCPQHVRVTRRRRWPHQLVLRLVLLLVLLLVGALLVTGCADQKEKYCEAVEDHQQELGEVLGDGTPTALLEALPIFRDLADEAPDDLRDEWRTVIDALEGLEQALDDAGVDAATYDRDHPPAGLSQTDKDAIDAAARRLTSDQTVAALNGVDQQAKDVCGTPLQA